MTRAQVVVVGAGPAGSVTALLLARAGVDVLIVDRRSFPRPKPCGDCLSAGAAHVLRRIGLLDSIAALPGARLHGWRIVAPDGAAVSVPFGDDAPDGALAIERSVLDAALLDAAVAAGARFTPGHAVTDLIREGDRIAGVRTRDGSIHAEVTLGADGLRSIVASRLGAVRRQPRLRKVSMTAHGILIPAAVKEGMRLGEMHVGNGLCAGIALVRADGRCNVTVVADSHRHGRDIARDRHAFMRSAIASLPRLRDRVDLDALDASHLLSSGPFDRPVRAVAFPGAALVGDAAGYFDPFTGQGVYQAMAGAEILAPAVARAVSGRADADDALRSYAAQHARLMRGSRFVQRGIEHVLAQTPLANATIARLARADDFARAVIRVTGDLAPATHLLSPRAVSSFFRPHSIGNRA